MTSGGREQAESPALTLSHVNDFFPDADGPVAPSEGTRDVHVSDGHTEPQGFSG